MGHSYQPFIQPKLVPNVTRVRHKQTLREGVYLKEPDYVATGTGLFSLIVVSVPWYDPDTKITEEHQVSWAKSAVEVLPDPVLAIVKELESVPADLIGTNNAPDVFLPESSGSITQDDSSYDKVILGGDNDRIDTVDTGNSQAII